MKIGGNVHSSERYRGDLFQLSILQLRDGEERNTKYNTQSIICCTCSH